MDVTDDEPKEEEELTCGWRRFTPKILQKLNTIKWFLVFLTIYSFMQGMTANGFTAAGLTALEKRFKLSSKQTGLIVAANDVSSLFLIIFISYYGGHSHKARWLGFGALVTSLGALLFALPHVLIDKYVPLEFEKHSAGANLCFVNNGTTVSQDQSTVCRNELHSSDWKYLFVFIGAKVLLGAGTTPLFTLGPAYIDENVDPKYAPMYIGTWFIATFFGPGIGYVAGGSLLTIWVDLIQPPGLDMTPDDPRWIGAWWLGYFFGGLLLLLSAIALLGYPREMPGSRERRARAIKEGLLPPRDENISGRMKDLIPATKSLLSNMTFMANTLALCATALIATGLGPFISKFIQSQFGEPSSTAGILTGVIIIPGTAGGIFLGSYLVKRIDLRKSCRQAAKYCFIFQFIGTWGVLTFIIPGCKTSLIAGINANYPANFSTQNTNMTSLCNIGCKCSTSAYFPVCGVDKTTYFSPCFAGCKKKIGTEEFDQCSCIAPATDASSFGFAKKGVCDRDCKNLIPFLFGALVLLVANFIVATPNKTVVLRCVPDNQRTYALGLQWLFLSIFGSVPGPVLFGTFIDKTCILWEDSCGRSGRCLEYDNELLSYFLVACGLFFHVLSTLFYFVSWYLIKRREDRAEALENAHENSLSEFASPVPGISGRREELTEDSTPLNQPITAHHSDIELVGYRGLDLARTPYPMTQHESSI